MTCRDIEPLILAERDGALTPAERAVLSEHIAACPTCAQLRTQLAASLETYKGGVASVRVPDVNEAWRELQAKMHASGGRPKKRPLAPVIWFGAPLAAAAAALAMVFLVGGSPLSRPAVKAIAGEVATANALPPPPAPPPPRYDPSIIAGADYVEAGDPNAATMVYVDKESGWLVVWVTDVDTPTSG